MEFGLKGSWWYFPPQTPYWLSLYFWWPSYVFGAGSLLVDRVFASDNINTFHFTYLASVSCSVVVYERSETCIGGTLWPVLEGHSDLYWRDTLTCIGGTLWPVLEGHSDLYWRDTSDRGIFYVESHGDRFYCIEVSVEDRFHCIELSAGDRFHCI